MKLVSGVLDPRSLGLIWRDLAYREGRPELWWTNRDTWSRELWEGFGGTVRITEVGRAVHGLVVSVLSRYHQWPRTQRISVQYAIWGEDSGINPHSDSRYRWAASLYLNDSWNPAWGGLLMVRPEPVVPLTGVLVINDNQELHAVSRVRVGAEPRVCLQVWAL